MSPLANELRRTPLGRCLDRTHQYARGDKHIVPSSLMVMLPMIRMRNDVIMRVEGKVPEPDMHSPVEDEDDFDLDEEEILEEEDRFA